tara:strand:- start:77 stop:1369 length:1293 start_codon:yes stop_codon:yes gene_type:complete
MPSTAKTSQKVGKPYFTINGNKKLSGVIKISGAKNSALVLMAASLLCEEKLIISNIPQLTDIYGMKNILTELGANVDLQNHQVSIQCNNLRYLELPYDLVKGLRASFFCIGPLLAKLGKARIPLPGGCQIGARPVIEHIKGLKALGANIYVEHGVVNASVSGSKRRLKGADIVLDCPSVGATETLIMAAAMAEGITTIENAAQEPEVEDLANMLNIMGAKIKGAGRRKLTIEGVKKLNGCSYKVIPDRIEAGTFLIAAAITRSDLRIEPVIPEHLKAVTQKLIDAGCLITSDEKSINISSKRIIGVDITTQPYPGFPTDLQAPFMALMATANGNSIITEKIYENRMQHVSELQRMGALIRIQGNTAVVEGVPGLSAAPVCGGDLRSAAAMTIASLSANGTSQVEGLNHLDRGYEEIEKKLNQAGANIIRT